MREIEEELMYEMANIRPNRTGLTFCIWVQEPRKKEKHYARIKVSTHYGDRTSDNLFTITIPDLVVIGDPGDIKSKDVDLAKKWASLNSDIILELWVGNLEIGDFINKIKSI